MPNHEYPTTKLERDRQAGLLICHCWEPHRVWLALWGAVECARCGRPVLR